ncbi:MAG: hypothetical protein ACXWT1_06695 [Methylobacter sp.]
MKLMPDRTTSTIAHWVRINGFKNAAHPETDVAGQACIAATGISNTGNVRLGRNQPSNYFNGDFRLCNSVFSAADIFNVYLEVNL